MTARKSFLATIALIEWIALVIQLVLMFQDGSMSTGATLVRFFSFFTILTNILVAVYATALWLKPADQQQGWFYSVSTATAVTLHILVVGLIYNLLLRNIMATGQMQTIIHEVLHCVTPALVLIYWWIWVPAKTLRYKAIFPWMIYPFVYAIITMFKGQAEGWYPYPFLNVNTLGYALVFRNIGGMIVLFMALAVLLVFIGKKKP